MSEVAGTAYGERVPQATGGGVVVSVTPESPAARGGVRAGDTIVSVDGQPLRDVIDWQWLTDGPAVVLGVRTASGAVGEQRLERGPGVPWGVEFTETVFDGVRTCRNRCAFCFMTQLPRGLRRALYLRDDDFRLSFLQGNFVTLTNLSDADVRRIAEQHLSPLYVSLHAVDADVRRVLVCAREDRALERFDELLDAGIDLHVQIVLVPGVNDGEVLERSLTWLAEREGVLSVGVVPLGYTSHQSIFSDSYEVADRARRVVDRLGEWQQAFRERDGVTWVYLADEFYLNAGLDLPPAEEYDGYPQFENGIGMVRSFEDEFAHGARHVKELAASLRETEVTLVTGELFAPVLERTLAASGFPPAVRVLPVANRFFGGNVSVAGLLTAADLVPAIAGSESGGVFLVPAVVANSDGLLLDGVPAAELGMRSGGEVRLISFDAGGLLSALRDVAASSPTS